MNQLELFAPRANEIDFETTDLGAQSVSAVVASAPTEVQAKPTVIESRIAAPEVAEEALILRVLHSITAGEFQSRLEPVLTGEERGALAVAERLPHQTAAIFDQIVERLTRRWADLAAWPAFGRIVEPRQELKRGLEALTLELFAPSRDLSGRVAFRVQTDLRGVAAPIPVPVLAAAREFGDAFRGFAYLEPLYTSRRREPKLLRSLAEVRREHCRPIDPIVIGWLGAGPRNYGLRFPVSKTFTWPNGKRNRRPSSLGELVFLIGHWD